MNLFGVLLGNSDVVRVLLEAGAKTHQTNRIGRTAAQLGAFTGQKPCVDTINNYVTSEDLKYYTVRQGAQHFFPQSNYSFCFNQRVTGN